METDKVEHRDTNGDRHEDRDGKRKHFFCATLVYTHRSKELQLNQFTLFCNP